MGKKNLKIEEKILGKSKNIEPPKKLSKHEQYLEDFRAKRKFHKIKENTIKEDIIRLRIFLSFCEDIKKMPDALYKTDFEKFFVYLEHDRKCCNETQIRYFNLLKVFYRLIESTAFDKFNEDYKETFMRKEDTKSYEDVNQEIVDNVIKEIIAGRSDTRYRDAIIILALWDTGCRRSEILNITYKDFDFKTGQIFITNTKSKKNRYVVVSEDTADLIWEYYSESTAKGPDDFIFQNERGKLGKKVKPNHISEVFRRAIDSLISKGEIKAGKRYVLHSLRHGRAVELLNDGTSVEIVKEILGHSDVKTTMTYAHAKNRAEVMLPKIREKLSRR